MAKAKKRDREQPSKPKRPAPVREPVYTVMAFITLVAITVGCALLYMDFEDYGSKTAPTEKVPALPKLGDDAATPAAKA